jgi:DNA-binding response OmpR family regulator
VFDHRCARRQVPEPRLRSDVQSNAGQPLGHKRVLIVEDEFLLGFSLLEDLTAAGAEVVGPISTVDEALQIATSESFDLAVLDINVRGEMSFGVADALLARNVPLVFLTGYDADVIPKRLQWLPRLGKPYDPKALAAALMEVVLKAAS